MHSFKDSTGKAWAVAINVAAVKLCRQLLGIDLLKVTDDNFALLKDILTDTVKLVDVLYVLCKLESDAKGLSDEDFGRLMLGDSLEEGAQAFQEALADFFPNQKIRESLRKFMAKCRELQAIVIRRGTEKADQEMAKLEPEKMADLVEKALANGHGTPSTNAPEYSASIRDHSPFANS